MRMFTPCCQSLTKSLLKNFTGSIKVFLVLFLLGCFVNSNAQRVISKDPSKSNISNAGQPPACTPGVCPNLPGQILVDGNPCEWGLPNLSTFPVHSYRLDAFGNGVVDSQFTEGTKDFHDYHNMVWSVSQTKAKNDIANGAAVLIGSNLYFAGDRTSNNGDAQIGFWFYLNGTAPIDSGGEKFFKPPHAYGDLLILADFTGGGRNGKVTVLKWVGTGGDVVGSNGTLDSTDCSGNVAENNDVIYPIPQDWQFVNPCYDLKEFYEGVVDLSCILGGGSPSVCFASFLLETRSSQEITASLDDFVSGGFAGKPQPTCENISINCTTPTRNYDPSVSGASTLQLRLPNGTLVSLPHNFTSSDAAGTYKLIATSQTGCSDSCSFTFAKDFSTVAPSCSAINLSCNNPSQQYAGSFAGATTVLKFGHTGSPLTLPYTFTSADAVGTYWVVTTSTTSGCKDSCSFVLAKDFDKVTPTCAPISLSCNNPSQQYVGSFAGASTVLKFGHTGSPMTLPYTFTSADAAGTYWVVTTKTSSGCKDSCSFELSKDFDKVTPTCAPISLDCSNPSQQYVGSFAGASTVLKFGHTGSPMTLPYTFTSADAAGTYWVVTTKTSSGCKDSCSFELSKDFDKVTPTCAPISLDCTNPSQQYVGSFAGATTVLKFGHTGSPMTLPYTFTSADAAGTYWVVTTKTSSGCKDSCSFELSKSFDAVTPTCAPINLSCNNPSQQYVGSFAGATTVLKFGHTGSPMTLPYTFTSADAAGTYWVVTTKTSSGCKDSCSFVLAKDFDKVTPTCAPINLSCNNPSQQYVGSFAGATTVLKFGHTGSPMTLPYTFTSADAAGTYWVVTTKTSSGCKDSCSFVLAKDFDKVTPTCAPINLSCNNPSQQYVGSFAGATTVLKFGHTGSPMTLPYTFTSADAVGTYWVVTTKTSSGCKDSCSFELSKDFNAPHVSCSANPTTIDITSAAHNSQLDVSLAGSVDTDPTHYTFAWTVGAGAAGSLNFNNIKNPVYTAGVLDAGGTVNFKVVVTNNITGCKDSSTCSVDVNTVGICPTVTTAPICSGTTNTYTANVGPTANETWVWSVNNGASINAPNGQQSVSVTAGSTSFTLTLTKSFANPDLDDEVCNFEVTVNPCGGFCTYTQGKYGNSSPACDGDGIDGNGPAHTYPTVTDMIAAMLDAYGELVLGDGTRKVTIPATASAAILLNASMPGGGGSRELLEGNCTVDSPAPSCWTAGNNKNTTYITLQNHINNVLLSQTITLGLNMRVSNGLGDFALQAGTFATAKAIGGCGSTTPADRHCDEFGVVVNEYVYKTISASVITALDNAGLPHTVEGLYTLANYALGNHDNNAIGLHTEYGASLSDIESAVAAINEGFDECRISMGWDKTPLVCQLPDSRITGTVVGEAGVANKQLSVSAFPNPFNDKLRFEIKSAVSGPATLEMYNMFGQKVKTLFKGNVFAGRGERVEYNVPSIQRTNMFYVLRVGDTQVAGKLISAKQ